MITKSLKWILFSVVLAAQVFAEPTVSIFVKDAGEFSHLQEELSRLQAGIGQNNSELDALMDQANRIAEMNKRCGEISLTEVLDEECGHFYSVDLPEFEARYLEVTGEIRLGSMTMASGLEQRTQQIDACVDALARIVVSKEQLLSLSGNVDLEPLSHSGSFDATFDFRLYFDENRMNQQKRLAERWLDKCREIILRKSGDEFAPLFIESVEQINDSLARSGANLKIILEPTHLSFYLDLNKNVAGAYYLSGVELFGIEAIPTGKRYSHLLVDIKNSSVRLPLGKTAEVQMFKGRVEFEQASSDLVGRWIWAADKKKAERLAKVQKAKQKKLQVDEAENAKQETRWDKGYAELDREIGKNSVQAPEKGSSIPANVNSEEHQIHWVPIGISAAAIVGGSVMAVLFNKKAKDEYEKGTPASKSEYDDRYDNAGSYQTMRTIGYGIAAVGVVGLGLSILF